MRKLKLSFWLALATASIFAIQLASPDVPFQPLR